MTGDSGDTLFAAAKDFCKSQLFQFGCLLLAAILLYGLAALGRQVERKHEAGTRLRVALFVNGTLGDKSFFDSAARGLARAQKELPVATKVIEGGTDPTRWEAGLSDIADSGDYDLIVAGTYSMEPYVQKIAQEFPSSRFVLFDSSVDYQACRCANVHSMLFRQNEGSYLAGFLAASLMKSGLPETTQAKDLATIGGMRIPVIDDFTIGFRAGVEAADPHAVILNQYANAFFDPAAGKEIAKALYGKGVGLIFHAAGATGQGVNEAAAEAHRYVIGVDMDQYALYHDSNPQLASHIVTSVVKNIDVGIYDAIKAQLQGKLVFGRAQSLGVAEGGIGLARTSDVLAQAPPAVIAALDAAQAAVIAGKVKVPSAFDAVTTEKQP